jgi:hypothetical protein
MQLLRSLHRFFGFENSSRPFAHISPGAILALVMLGVLAACSSPTSADKIAAANGLAGAQSKDAGYIPVEKTTVVGSIRWASPVDSIGVIEINADTAPMAVGTILMSRDPHTLKPSALMRTTDRASGHIVGVMLINGIPTSNDEVIEPGPDLKSQVDYNLEQNQHRLDNHAVDNTTSGTGTPNQGIAPGM